MKQTLTLELLSAGRAQRRETSIQLGRNDRRFVGRSVPDRKKEADRTACRKPVKVGAWT